MVYAIFHQSTFMCPRIGSHLGFETRLGSISIIHGTHMVLNACWLNVAFVPRKTSNDKMKHLGRGYLQWCHHTTGSVPGKCKISWGFIFRAAHLVYQTCLQCSISRSVLAAFHFCFGFIWHNQSIADTHMCTLHVHSISPRPGPKLYFQGSPCSATYRLLKQGCHNLIFTYRWTDKNISQIKIEVDKMSLSNICWLHMRA